MSMLLLYYMIGINAITFIVYGIDKLKARKGRPILRNGSEIIRNMRTTNLQDMTMMMKMTKSCRTEILQLFCYRQTSTAKPPLK